MKKIMFNDRYGLTQAVLEGRKTQTRRNFTLTLYKQADKGGGLTEVFPASVYGGIKGCKALHGPFGNIKFVPTGGVGLENLQDYAKLPFIHAVGGGWLCDKKDMLNGNYARISETAKKSIDVLLGFGVIGEDSIPVSFHSVAENEKRQGKQSIYTNSVERAIYYLGKYGWKMEKREEDRVCLKDEQGAEVCLVQA